MLYFLIYSTSFAWKSMGKKAIFWNSFLALCDLTHKNILFCALYHKHQMNSYQKMIFSWLFKQNSLNKLGNKAWETHSRLTPNFTSLLSWVAYYCYSPLAEVYPDHLGDYWNPRFNNPPSDPGVASMKNSLSSNDNFIETHTKIIAGVMP